jgi:hypothetical protein
MHKILLKMYRKKRAKNTPVLQICIAGQQNWRNVIQHEDTSYFHSRFLCSCDSKTVNTTDTWNHLILCSFFYFVWRTDKNIPYFFTDICRNFVLRVLNKITLYFLSWRKFKNPSYFAWTILYSTVLIPLPPTSHSSNVANYLLVTRLELAVLWCWIMLIGKSWTRIASWCAVWRLLSHRMEGMRPLQTVPPHMVSLL